MYSLIKLIIISFLCRLIAGAAERERLEAPGEPRSPEAPGGQNACQAEVARLQGSVGSSPPPGMHLPQCLSTGWYNPEQIDGSTGYNWCVDPSSGNEIEGTRQGPSDQGAQACPKCLTDKASSLPETPRAGNYVPQCDGTGYFSPKQFYGSTGYSWCVDRFTGEEIPDTRVGPGQPKTNMPC